MPTTLRLRGLAALPLVSLLVLAGGCASDDAPRGAEMHRKPPTPLAGHENFFAGQILAEVRVGNDGMPEPGAGGERGTSSGSGGEGRGGRRGGGGGGRMRMAGGNGGYGGDVSGSVPFGGGGSGGAGPRPRMMGGRPVAIHLRFTNQGATAATVWILDFVSPLGNFVVRPDHVVVEPGQSIETDPMSSELAGEISGTEATLRLRVGDQTEKKTFQLTAVSPPPDAAPPAEK